MSLTLSVVCIKITNCFPSPCTRLSLARTTTEAPLPCRVFRAFAHSLSASRFRQSPVSTHSNYWHDRLSDATFVLFLLIASASWLIPFAHIPHVLELSITKGRRYNCLSAHATLYAAELSLNQCRLHPCICLSPWRNCTAWQLAVHSDLLKCYFRFSLSVRAYSVGSRTYCILF